MAVSRWTAWVGAGLLARLLMSVRFVLANHTDVELTGKDYYKLQSYKAIVAVVLLLVGMLLSICATFVSARLRAKAMNDPEGV